VHADASAGIIRTAAFTNGSAGGRYVAADGAWLATPDAVLLGDAGSANAAEAVLLSLSSPIYDADTQARMLLLRPATVWATACACACGSFATLWSYLLSVR
jgi:hypothetical protein